MKTNKKQIALHVVLILLVLITLFPIIFALSNSFKNFAGVL
jgi:sn-glycerol 3-phosphate transport system permease protein